MKWPSLKTKEIRFIAVALAGIFIFLNYLFIIPWGKRSHERYLALKELKSDVAKREETIQRKDQWAKELSSLDQKKESKSPHIENAVAWMKHVDELAAKSKVTIQSRPSSSSSEFENKGDRANSKDSSSRLGKMNSNRWSMNCALEKGTWESVIKFLYDLNMDPAHPQIEKCNIAPPKSTEDSFRGNLTISVVLKPK